MKLLVPSLLVLSTLAFVPTPAAAEPCHVDDVGCMTQCMADLILQDDPCAIWQMDPSPRPCDAGQTGVVLQPGARAVRACVSIPSASVGACGAGETGFVLYVDGRPSAVCVA